MKEHIKKILSDTLPAVDFDSDFLFSELDSLSIVTIMVMLSEEYKIKLSPSDVTPKNFKTIETLAKMVESKINQ